MPKILTLTFSPCIDKSSATTALIPEKKLSCSMPKMEPGGGGINVARAIQRLGGSATAIYPAGGYMGRLFNHLLQQEQVPTLAIESFLETRENFIMLESSTNNQYRFGMPGNALADSEWQQCLQAVSDADGVEYIVASGSLPPGVPMDIYAKLSKIAKQKGAKLIVDTSGIALQEALEEGVYLIKPNLGELAFLVGKETLHPDEIKNAAQSLLTKGGCEVMVVSMGAEGAMLVTATFSAVVKPPPVKRVSTVGAGDSMVAGIVFELSQGKEVLSALQFGVACGTAATLNAGTALFKIEDVTTFYHQIQKAQAQ